MDDTMPSSGPSSVPPPGPVIEAAGLGGRLDRLLADATHAVLGSGARRRTVTDLPGPETGCVSVWLGNLDGLPLLSRDDTVRHYAASTMKLPLLVAAYRLHDAGLLDLDQEVEVRPRFVSVADGSAFSLQREDDQDDETWDRTGGRCSLRTLAHRSIVASGNLATNLLFEQVGPAAVARVLADAGCSPATSLPRGIGDAVARDAGQDNLVTAADLGLVLAGVADRRLASPDTCAAVEAVLARQEYREGIPLGVPTGTYVANKTGWVEAVSHDVALVRPDDGPGYVLVVLTSLDVPEETSTRLIREVSRLVWDGPR